MADGVHEPRCPGGYPRQAWVGLLWRIFFQRSRGDSLEQGVKGWSGCLGTIQHGALQTFLCSGGIGWRAVVSAARTIGTGPLGQPMGSTCYVTIMASRPYGWLRVPTLGVCIAGSCQMQRKCPQKQLWWTHVLDLSHRAVAATLHCILSCADLNG